MSLKNITAFFIVSFIALPVSNALFAAVSADRMEWNTVAGWTSENSRENIIIWSYLKSAYYEAGIYSAAGNFMFYGGVDYLNNEFTFQAGYMFRSLFHGFILSPGGYLPESKSSPDMRPVGLAAGFKKNWFSAAAGYYLHQSIDRLANMTEKTQVSSFAVNWFFDKWEMTSQTGYLISGTAPPTSDMKSLWEYMNPYFSLSAKISRVWEINAIYSAVYGGAAHSSLFLNKYLFGLDFIYQKKANPWAALIYNQNLLFYAFMKSDFLILKIYEKKEIITGQTKIMFQNWILYNYVNTEINLSGLIYHSPEEKLAPYMGVYASYDFKVYYGSLGFSFGEIWMLCLVYGLNGSGRFYPYDPEIIPDRFYLDNLQFDSYTFYNHSYTGAQFFWNQENMFFYLSFLENFEEKINSLVFTARLMYKKEF
ncbi:MAG: hypothetical protein OEV66_02265 [Spirochaetia bacterium]|nr:hypothetical protein [Spirochaetia bacterium]